MTCLASAIGGGRVVCILLTACQKSTSKFRKFGEGNVSPLPSRLGQGWRMVSRHDPQSCSCRFDSDPCLQLGAPVAQMDRVHSSEDGDLSSNLSGGTNSILHSLMVSRVCEVYSNKDSYSLDSVSVRRRNRGEAIHAHRFGISRTKPFFLLSACRDAISNNMLGQVAYSTCHIMLSEITCPR